MGAPFFWHLWHSMQAMLSSFLAFAKFGTGKGLLRYRICVPCSKRLPAVRDAFSEALRAQNRLLGYGRNIRYRKRLPMVRDTSSEARNSRLRRLWTAFCCTGHIFKGAELPPAAPNAFWDVTGATAFQTAGLSPVHKRKIGYIGSEESEEPTNNQEGRPKRSASARRRANKIRGRPLSLSRLFRPLNLSSKTIPQTPPHLKYGLNY